MVNYTGPLIIKAINTNNNTYRLATETIILQTNNQSTWIGGYSIVVRNAGTGKEHIVLAYFSPNITTLNFTLPDI